MSTAERKKQDAIAQRIADMPSASDITSAVNAPNFDLDLKDLSLSSASKSVLSSSDTTVTPETVVKRKSQAELTKDKERKITNIFVRMKKARKVYLCFLVDCTGSMSPWINEVKENVKRWSTKLNNEYTDMELQVAFVRYTDYDQPEDTRTTSIDFTHDLDQFYRFVDAISAPAGVGGDQAEDVFGGLHRALKLTWPKEGTKVLVHITDAPCHGRQYHDSNISDNHPDEDPSGLKLNNLMRLVAAQGIAYYFGYIKKSATNDMIKVFNVSLKEASSRMMNIREFDISKAEDVFEGVYSSVASSISTYINSFVHQEKGDKMTLRDFTIEEECPDWTRMSSKVVEVFSPPPPGSGVEALPKIGTRMSLKIAPQPFKYGSLRLAFHGYDPNTKERLVFKQFMYETTRLSCRKRFYEAIQVYAVASSVATEFNKQLPYGAVKIKFNPVGFVKFVDGGKKTYFTYEPYLEGDYIKYTNNVDYSLKGSSKFTEACQTFSHFSWSASKTQLVCDLQGVVSEDRSTLVLTDPAIHNTNVLFHGDTNLGNKGIDAFFIGHSCNDICRRMGLKRPSTGL